MTKKARSLPLPGKEWYIKRIQDIKEPFVRRVLHMADISSGDLGAGWLSHVSMTPTQPETTNASV